MYKTLCNEKKDRVIIMLMMTPHSFSQGLLYSFSTLYQLRLHKCNLAHSANSWSKSTENQAHINRAFHILEEMNDEFMIALEISHEKVYINGEEIVCTKNLSIHTSLNTKLNAQHSICYI